MTTAKAVSHMASLPGRLLADGGPTLGVLLEDAVGVTIVPVPDAVPDELAELDDRCRT